MGLWISFGQGGEKYFTSWEPRFLGQYFARDSVLKFALYNLPSAICCKNICFVKSTILNLLRKIGFVSITSFNLLNALYFMRFSLCNLLCKFSVCNTISFCTMGFDISKMSLVWIIVDNYLKMLLFVVNTQRRFIIL